MSELNISQQQDYQIGEFSADIPTTLEAAPREAKEKAAIYWVPPEKELDEFLTQPTAVRHDGVEQDPKPRRPVPVRGNDEQPHSDESLREIKAAGWVCYLRYADERIYDRVCSEDDENEPLLEGNMRAHYTFYIPSQDGTVEVREVTVPVVNSFVRVAEDASDMPPGTEAVVTAYLILDSDIRPVGDEDAILPNHVRCPMLTFGVRPGEEVPTDFECWYDGQDVWMVYIPVMKRGYDVAAAALDAELRKQNKPIDRIDSRTMPSVSP